MHSKSQGCQTLRSERSRYRKYLANVPDVTSCVYTQSRTFGFFTASSSILIVVAANPIFFQLFNLIFHIRELKNHHDRGDGAEFSIYRRHCFLLLVERVER